jgi:hypothetical protein
MGVVAKSKSSELRRRCFELQKLSAQRCLEPSESCSLTPISAHSIQNANILDRLCFEGHVIMPKLKAQGGRMAVSFEPVGRNHATTFTGLCSKHDQAIFDPIDNGPIDAGSGEHLFLLAYRSVLRELHAALSGAIKIQLGFQNKVDLALTRGDTPTREGLVATEHLMNACDLWAYKGEYDAAYSTRDFHRIQHMRFFEPGRLPTLAVSALFSLDSIFVGDDVARVALNVYPSGDGAMILFSFLRSHANYIHPFLETFKAASGDRLLQMISVRILNTCENFVIAPPFLNGLDDSTRREICDFYASSLLADATALENHHFMLFSPKHP